MLTEIELQNKIDSVISKLQKCNESVVTNVLTQHDCKSIDELKVMLEKMNYRTKVYATFGSLGAVGAGLAVAGRMNNDRIMLRGGAGLFAVSVYVLIRLLLHVRAWKKQQQRLNDARKSGNLRNINKINQKVNMLSSKISKDKTELKQKVSKLPPDKKAEFLKKAEKLKAKFKIKV